jgi:predicted negative regulator of RcsB-dependent stress response
LIRETGADTYAFDHALTQQVLYAELPGRRKRKLHLAAAEALERLPAGSRLQHSGELTWHFLEAASEARALPYAITAGDQAARMFAPREAERLYGTALEIAEQIGDRASATQTLARRAQLLLDTFQGKGALRDYQRLLDEARRRGDRREELDALLGLARASYVVALDETKLDLATACRQLYEDAYQLARELDDKRATVRALLGTRWFADFWPQHMEKVIANLQEALAISREIGDEDLVIGCQLATWRLLPRAEGEELSEELGRRLREQHNLHRLNDLYFGMMWANYQWGRLERAVDACDAGIKLADEIGVPPVQYPTLKALALLRLGRFGDAREALEREVIDEQHAFGQAMQTLGTGMYFLELLEYENAAEAFRSLVEQARRLRRTWMRTWGQELLVRSLLGAGKLDSASVAKIEADLDQIPATLAADVMAEVHLAQQRPAEAVSQAETAALQAQQKGRTPAYLGALEVKARALLQLGRLHQAVAAADEALALADEIRALPMVRRIQEVRGGMLLRLGRKDEAGQAFEAATDAANRLAESISDATLKRQFLASPEIRAIGGDRL